jgi:VWFA-related protein
MKHGIVLALAILASWAVVLVGQDASSDAQESLAIFRAGVEAVEVDAVVTDASGNPVAGLTVDDFEVFEDGEPQIITAFTQVDVPLERSERVTVAGVTVDPDVESNSAPDGRLYVFALDGVAADQALRTRVFVRRFIEEHFNPGVDVGAISVLGAGSGGAAQSPTRNPRLLLDALDRFSGGFSTAVAPPPPPPEGAPNVVPPPNPRKPEAEGLLRIKMADLRALVDSVARIRGRRKIVILISEGWGSEVPDELNMDRLVTYHGGSLTISESRAHAAIVAATRNNVTIYAVDPRGVFVEGSGGEVESQEPADTGARGLARHVARHNLEALADVTGGFALVSSNSFEQAFDRIVRENSAYYVLGFSSGNSRRSGRFRRLEVRVKRAGLQVRSRGGYVEPLGRERTPEPAPRALPLSAAVGDVLASPVTESGIPLRVAAAPYYVPGERDAHVTVVVEIDASRLQFVETDGAFSGGVEIAYTSINNKNTVSPGAYHKADLSSTMVSHERLMQNGLRALLDIGLRPGRHQLRVAVGDGASRAGSVVYDLDVPDFTDEPLMLSGVLLASASLSGTTFIRADGARREVVPSTVTASREFPGGDVVSVLAHVYENGRRPPAGPIVLTAELLAERGDVIRSATGLQPPGSGGRPRSYAFALPLSLEDIAPGRYVIRVKASQRGEGAALPVERLIPVRVR